MTPATTTIAGISGSLRRGSYNTALLQVAATVLPPGVDLELLSLRDVPMYDADVEREIGFPPPVTELRAGVAAADALLVATPEYNWSVSGALKNAIDWLSRRPEAPLDDKPVAIMGGGGRSGTVRAQRHLREILTHNRARLVETPEVLVARVWEQFDAELHPTNPAMVAEVSGLVEALCRLTAEGRPGTPMSPEPE